MGNTATHSSSGHGAHDGHGHTDGHEAPLGGGVKPVWREHDFIEKLYVPAIATGLGVTLRHFFKNVFGKEKYIQTVQYPDVKAEYPQRFRGMHRLVPRADGKPRCVACFMCQTACPARCIHIEAGETDDKSIEKFPLVFEIDELRCVMCGLCVEACPCDAIRMDTGFHPPPVTSREAANVGRADLLSYFGRDEAPAKQRDPATPPPTAGGLGRVDRSDNDDDAGGARGGF
jgi:NADH-quinone oxidoreductase subunit I